MKIIFKLFILVLIIISCKQKTDKTNISKTSVAISLKQLSNKWSDSLFITNTWVKTFYTKMDSISFKQIEELRKDNKYPFYKLNTTLAKKYIKNYSEINLDEVYLISKQYCNNNYNSLILFHLGDCIYDIYLVTINKADSKFIDSEKIFFWADNCTSNEIIQNMTTYFSDNKFEIKNILEYWESDDKQNEDPAQMNIHVIDSTLMKCIIESNGIIKRDKKKTKNNVP